ncbi:thioredoxin family protein [Octadecabacter sp.]|nr:thioredoxin family protein [Octadecabacter sp.]
MFKVLTSAFILATILVVPSLCNAQPTLMMAEEPGCIWCAAWNREIDPVYDRTGEGAAAALRRIDITDPIPDDITLSRVINFTPTFVLLIDGTEVSRLEGYPGEDFFWGLLGTMLNEQGIPFEIKTTGDLSQ